MKTKKMTFKWIVRGWSENDVEGKVKLDICPRIGEKVEIEIEGELMECKVSDVVHSKKGTTLKMNLWTS